MNTLITLLQFFAALAILVTLHELGHFLAARAFGIKVEKFYLFFDAFGVKLFKFKKGDTEYGIGWLPLGGYVKIAGMVDESLDTNQLKSEPQPWEFRSKPAWQRLIVMVGGVFVNLVLGIVVISGLIFSQGETYIPNTVVNELGGVYASPDARKLGLQIGDKILALNGKPVDNLLGEFGDPSFLTGAKKEISINRNGKDTLLILPVNMEDKINMNSDLPFISPRYEFSIGKIVGGSPADKAGIKATEKIIMIDSQPVKSFFEFKETLTQKSGKTVSMILQDTLGATRITQVQISEDGTIGFQPSIGGFDGKSKKIEYGLIESVTLGSTKSFGMISANLAGLKKVVSGQVNAKSSLAGPIGIAQMYGPRWDWINFWTLTATLSLALALMNILPIPALDGGHVMFLLYEIIARRPVNDRVLYIGQLIGMAILLSLFVFIFWVDISRLLGF
jgi:regulator of sigma E protease